MLKVSKGVEQGVFVLLMLALQKDHTPVKSNILSDTLSVSDSYLKKILRKLVVAGLISSNASKDGGFQLKKSIEKISFLDVCMALDPIKEIELQNMQLANHIFPNDPEHVKKSEQTVIDVFSKGTEAFYKELKAVSLAKLLKEEKYTEGTINWAKQLEK
ncbi:MAG: Rrf2 family transcriptional regulator [Liquorilactobacillus sp.]|uniref:RrF2 family transcriptional regulator n=1 Tax=Liquorilactobacillus TaxID=2767888 RepID=UPI0039ED5885